MILPTSVFFFLLFSFSVSFTVSTQGAHLGLTHSLRIHSSPLYWPWSRFWTVPYICHCLIVSCHAKLAQHISFEDLQLRARIAWSTRRGALLIRDGFGETQPNWHLHCTMGFIMAVIPNRPQAVTVGWGMLVVDFFIFYILKYEQSTCASKIWTHGKRMYRI